ncbi:MAG: hypothetical protein FWE03_01410 [Firmicutes bacterium]|nr:hypothetical protein [Bacillota bacterium]
MKGWIKLLVIIGPKVRGLYQSIEKRIEKESLCMGGTCEMMMDLIYNLNERKRRIINLAVLHRALKEGLSDEEFYIIKTEGKCLEGKFKRNSLVRRVDKAFFKAAKVIHSMGYDDAVLIREYPGYARQAERYAV